MLYTKTINSEEHIEALKNYVISRINNSVLLKDDGSTGSYFQFENAKLISAVDFDETHGFMNGFGGDSSPCEEWLVGTILAFLGSENFPLVLIEDFIANSSDPVFSQEPTAPIWCYRDRVLWPIQKDMANVESCKNSLAWAAGGPEVIFFCSPVDLSDLTVIPARFTVSENCLSKITNSLKYIVIDIFDSEGYVVLPIINRTTAIVPE